MTSTTRNYVNAITTPEEAQEAIALCNNNFQGWTPQQKAAHNKLIAALLNRKWELQGSSTTVHIAR